MHLEVEPCEPRQWGVVGSKHDWNLLCNCCNRFEMDTWTNGGPACQWCLAACRDADECQVTRRPRE